MMNHNYFYGAGPRERSAQVNDREMVLAAIEQPRVWQYRSAVPYRLAWFPTEGFVRQEVTPAQAANFEGKGN